MNEELKAKLIELADKYETPSFIEKDPSLFMHKYESVRDQEIIAFISANLAFGRRDQILSHVAMIESDMNNKPYEWLMKKKYLDFFPESSSSFYRVYSYSSMRIMCSVMNNILSENNSLGEYYKKLYHEACDKNTAENNDERIFLSEVIASTFPEECTIISHGKNSAAKRLQMFLRWMVRDNSPVDLGLWTSWYDKKNLIMPLDTHVMQEATKFNLLSCGKNNKPKSASLKTAVELTDVLSEAFPDDPVKGDFALFGLGVDSEK